MNPMSPDMPLWLQPGGKQLEFKRDLSSPRNLLKTLVAFANSAGGKLVRSRRRKPWTPPVAP